MSIASPPGAAAGARRRAPLLLVGFPILVLVLGGCSGSDTGRWMRAHVPRALVSVERWQAAQVALHERLHGREVEAPDENKDAFAIAVVPSNSNT